MSSGKAMTIVVISLLILALIYSSFSRSYVFAAISSSPITCERVLLSVKCCQTTTDDEGIEMTWCTYCDNTKPPSNCGPRFQPDKAPPPVLPPKLPPSVVTTEPPSVAPPNGSSPTVPGTIDQPPSTVKDNSNTTSPPSTSQRVVSPTESCNPTPFPPSCIPCPPLSTNPECYPVSQCVPPRCIPPRTNTGAPEEQKPLVPPTTGPLGENAPQVAPPTAPSPEEVAPTVDCTKNPDDPSCATRLKPTVDCTKDPDDPLCKTVGINPPPSDSANLAPDNNKNNNPPSTEDNKPKGSELGQSIGGGLSATKKGNKDNSPTPPPCPTDNSPIPPNCTLKPKF